MPDFFIRKAISLSIASERVPVGSCQLIFRSLLINSSQNKNATAKNTAGKILGYRINLFTTIIAKDLMTGDEILYETFSYSSTYKTQEEFFETKKMEKQAIENLIHSTYQDLIIKLSESLL